MDAAAAHLAGEGNPGVQLVHEGSNTDGQRVVENWQLDLKEQVWEINSDVGKKKKKVSAQLGWSHTGGLQRSP